MYTDQHGNTLVLESTPLGSGKEGKVFAVKNFPAKVAKIYTLSPKSVKVKKKKLTYMTSNSPLVNATTEVRNFIAWPESMIFEKRKFVGYLMPKISDSEKLTILASKKIRKKYSLKYDKFDFSQKKSQTNRMTLCYNIARALDVLHSTGRFVFTDLKPSNLMVDSKGIISLIDLDAIQMIDSGLFLQADAITLDYSPPEIKNYRGKKPLDANWDYFSFAVVIYQLLVGSHPFSGKVIGIENTLPNEMIQQGFFAMGKKKARLEPNNHHTNFNKLPTKVKAAFCETFDSGHNAPSQRIDFYKWALLLEKELNFITGVPSFTFKAINQFLFIGQNTNLVWDIPSGQNVNIQPGIGNVLSKGNITVSPTTNTDYVISFEANNKTYTKAVNIKINHSNTPANKDVVFTPTKLDLTKTSLFTPTKINFE